MAGRKKRPGSLNRYFKLVREEDAARGPLEKARLLRILGTVEEGRCHRVRARARGRLQGERHGGAGQGILFKVEFVLLYHYEVEVPREALVSSFYPYGLRLPVLAPDLGRPGYMPPGGRYRTGLEPQSPVNEHHADGRAVSSPRLDCDRKILACLDPPWR